MTVYRMVLMNSKDYWNNRFRTDWEAKNGRRQSAFFARLAVRNLPVWFLHHIRTARYTICDWGCAQGDGTGVLAGLFGRNVITGIDFSPVAIETARQSYPRIRFQAEDWLTDSTNSIHYDVVFSSNTLEHFHQPDEVLPHLWARTARFLVLLLPYREFVRDPEHHHTFEQGNIRILPAADMLLVHAAAVDATDITPYYWDGEQILLIYARLPLVMQMGLVLEDVSLLGIGPREINGRIQQAVSARDIRIHDLVQRTSEQDQQLAERNQQLAEQDQQLAERNQQLAEQEQQLAERNQKAAALNNKLEDQKQEADRLHETVDILNRKIQQLNLAVSNHERMLTDMQHSASWKVTAPLRAGYDLCLKAASRIYRILQLGFRYSPDGIKTALAGPAERLMHLGHKMGLAPRHTTASNVQPEDITWEEFHATVLSRRDQYRGIFIQEMTIDWNVPLFQRPQHIASAMARRDFLVIYKTAPWGRDVVPGFRPVSAGLWLTSSYHVDFIEGAVRSFYSTGYYYTPEMLVQASNYGTVIYEYIDHIDPLISGDHKNIQMLLALKNHAFKGGVDYIVASSRKLWEEAAGAFGKERVLLVPNGVDVNHYRNPAHAQVVLPSELTAFCQQYMKIAGYFGAIAPWLWYECIQELVRLRSEVGFVFIGPDYFGGVRQLPRAQNLLYLGAVDYQILPAYARSFDICFIPFAPGDIAQTTSPLKLFEYFALEKPVVVTCDMLECTAFPQVFAADSARGLAQAIDQALAVKDDPDFKTTLAQLADENDWVARTGVMERVFNLK